MSHRSVPRVISYLVAVQYARLVLEVFVGSFEAELKPYAGVTDKLKELVASDLQFDTIRTAGKFNNEDYRDPHRT